MHVRVSPVRSRFVPLKAAGVFGSVLLVAAVAVGMALASVTEIKRFDATISAPARPSAAPQTYTFTLTNDPASNQTIGSANLTVPLGYVPLVYGTPGTFTQSIVRPGTGGAWVSTGKMWKAPFYDSTTRNIELRTLDSKNALAAGERLVLTFSATAACGVPLQWPTGVKQSNNFLGNGNDFTGPSPTLSVTSATKFTFDTISDQVVAREFGVTVRATDGCPGTVPFNGTRMLRGLTGVADQQVTFTNGVATTTLTPVQTQTDARLRVVDPSNSSSTIDDPSTAFAVVEVLCEYDPDHDAPCEASDPDRKTTLTTPQPPPGATIGFSFGALGTGSTCAGSTFTARGPVANVDPKYPASYDGPPLSFVGRWDKSIVPGTGVANFIFCMSKDGLVYEIVPQCTKSGGLPPDQLNPAATKPYCELHRSRNGVGDLIIRFLIAPEDPFVGLG
jgi:hypothetical protein